MLMIIFFVFFISVASEICFKATGTVNRIETLTCPKGTKLNMEGITFPMFLKLRVDPGLCVDSDTVIQLDECQLRLFYSSGLQMNSVKLKETNDVTLVFNDGKIMESEQIIANCTPQIEESEMIIQFKQPNRCVREISVTSRSDEQTFSLLIPRESTAGDAGKVDEVTLEVILLTYFAVNIIIWLVFFGMVVAIACILCIKPVNDNDVTIEKEKEERTEDV
ncbi:unnamed protein product [Bursaphelenchus xylophilus]|uniref:(pine wood nematode) hypothetical protein n=1 Tax=Bursaphelenchus xylophilus TaxID=6326 RepID=A0A1I7SVV9_BURXY|nr:unnamed protein product [Bursaphelenchus xylophilus]CAG9098368.1 unnamed protein product [Bursaphelenchus xylophilus]